ncbi:MAG: PspC family transcriptional regulator [Bacteroidetes bacterium]|nr:PspC family transcriptional regulator [Bacteroidota bacterium]MCB9043648.1 PspC family transcriptional regulator [Chitinophagales bacterium]
MAHLLPKYNFTENISEKLRDFVELRIFGVCNYLGEKLGIAKAHIQLFFIYATFIATWSPIILYLIIAFWMNIKQYISSNKRNIREL